MAVTGEVHLLVDGAQTGPHTIQEVVDGYRAGTVPTSALYWFAGMAEWGPISHLVQPPPPPGMGAAGLTPSPGAPPPATTPSLGYDTRTHEFTGTLSELLRLGVRAVQSRGWTVTDADDSVGLLTFETRMSWGSWSGITATLSFAETSPYRWRVHGTGKQNVRGHQLAALDLGESDRKVRQAIETMIELAPRVIF